LTPLPHQAGIFDIGPAWLADGRLAFTSDRMNIYTTLFNYTQSQLHAFDLDGRNVQVLSYESFSGERHPILLTDGRLAFSSWQLFGMFPHRTGRIGGGATTLENLFHIWAEYADGSSHYAVFCLFSRAAAGLRLPWRTCRGTAPNTNSCVTCSDLRQALQLLSLRRERFRRSRARFAWNDA